MQSKPPQTKEAAQPAKVTGLKGVNLHTTSKWHQLLFSLHLRLCQFVATQPCFKSYEQLKEAPQTELQPKPPQTEGAAQPAKVTGLKGVNLHTTSKWHPLLFSLHLCLCQFVATQPCFKSYERLKEAPQTELQSKPPQTEGAAQPAKVTGLKGVNLHTTSKWHKLFFSLHLCLCQFVATQPRFKSYERLKEAPQTELQSKPPQTKEAAQPAKVTGLKGVNLHTTSKWHQLLFSLHLCPCQFVATQPCFKCAVTERHAALSPERSCQC